MRLGKANRIEVTNHRQDQTLIFLKDQVKFGFFFCFPNLLIEFLVRNKGIAFLKNSDKASDIADKAGSSKCVQKSNLELIFR